VASQAFAEYLPGPTYGCTVASVEMLNMYQALP
jgi:hypothetical protein